MISGFIQFSQSQAEIYALVELEGEYMNTASIVEPRKELSCQILVPPSFIMVIMPPLCHTQFVTVVLHQVSWLTLYINIYIYIGCNY